MVQELFTISVSLIPKKQDEAEQKKRPEVLADLTGGIKIISDVSISQSEFIGKLLTDSDTHRWIYDVSRVFGVSMRRKEELSSGGRKN
ncbi:MAG TPA: hypothetical protein GX523_00755 [Desulfitobacterium dehalogenans]|uniref:Uncharacterized protein n=1 Tax=Desulfitobacterium dehalogenans TaxID=36854 RepID=A0A7C7D7F5_9FIRM|nr:hypothetical protein [Desulfitobacterium dehalogenans]